MIFDNVESSLYNSAHSCVLWWDPHCHNSFLSQLVPDIPVLFLPSTLSDQEDTLAHSENQSSSLLGGEEYVDLTYSQQETIVYDFWVFRNYSN